MCRDASMSNSTMTYQEIIVDPKRAISEREMIVADILTSLIRDLRTVTLPNLNWAEVDVDDRNIIIARWRKMITASLENNS